MVTWGAEAMPQPGLQGWSRFVSTAKMGNGPQAKWMGKGLVLVGRHAGDTEQAVQPENPHKLRRCHSCGRSD